MILTSTGNETAFDKIADALQKQHGKTHVRTSTSSSSSSWKGGKGSFRRNWAHRAEFDDWSDIWSEGFANDDWHDSHSSWGAGIDYEAHQGWYEGDDESDFIDDEIEACELNVLTAQCLRIF